MANRVEEAVEKIAEEILANTDYELVDVEYVKERDWFYVYTSIKKVALALMIVRK